MAKFADKMIALDLPDGWRQQSQTGRRIREADWHKREIGFCSAARMCDSSKSWQNPAGIIR